MKSPALVNDLSESYHILTANPSLVTVASSSQLRAIIENKETESTQLRLMVASMSDALGDDKVAEIKQKVTEKLRRISNHGRKSNLVNGAKEDDFRFNLESMAKSTPRPGRMQKAASRRTVIALQGQDTSPSQLQKKLAARRPTEGDGGSPGR